MNPDVDFLMSMATNPIRNYVLPGLESHLIAGTGKGAKARIFRSTRNTYDAIIPHNHRFDIFCYVLQGKVENCIWKQMEHPTADLWQRAILRYQGIGEYEAFNTGEPEQYLPIKTVYEEGRTYTMKAKDIHSIEFAKDTIVLFIESEEKTAHSKILRPVVDGKVIDTFQVKSWMFEM